MCVTNTTARRPQPVTFNTQQVGVTQSLLSQRLLGTYIPTLPVKPQPVYNHNEIQIQMPSELVSTAPQEKQRPKRRRKPQKPGKTAKNNERHFVVHNYHDHSLDDDFEDEEDAEHRRRGGVSIAFPLKLHAVLDQVEADGLAHVVSWQGHGRAFVIHNPKEFVDHVMPKYFRQSKLTSFQRQLNLYGFCRLTRGPDAGGYYHELFLRGRAYLCKKMIRTKVKGTKFKAASSPEAEPDFYQMPPIVVSPHNSDEDLSHNYGGSHCYAPESNVASATASYIEPLPMQFAQLTRAEPPPLYYAQAPSAMAVQHTFQFPGMLSIPDDADRILDEAVDELFLHQEGGADNLEEFVHDWDPNFCNQPNAGGSIEDDSQLGYLLEKLLED